MAQSENKASINEEQVTHSGDKIRNKIYLKSKKGNINISINKKRERHVSQFYNNYNIQQYDLHPNYWFDHLSDLIPKGVDDFVDEGNNYVERIIEALYHFKQCALIGPSGTGKTHMVYLVAELTGLPLWEVNCALQTSTYELVGKFIGLGTENWVDGPVTQWVRNGGLLYLDEANMMRQDVASRLNSILDARGHLIIAEKDNEVIRRHNHSYCIISINPIRTEYVGVKRLNMAFRRRMSVWIEFNYQSVGNKISENEVGLIVRRSQINEDVARKILQVGAELRRQYLEGDLFYGPSPRDLINWAILFKNSQDPVQSAESTIIALASDDVDVQNEIRRLITNVF